MPSRASRLQKDAKIGKYDVRIDEINAAGVD